MTKDGNSQITRTITLLITIFSLSLPAYAQYSGGTGEPNNPYLIYTAEQLNAIGAEPNDWDKHFKLMADIDLNGFGETDFNIIGSIERPFTGMINGSGYEISGFNYSASRRDCIGLFGYVDDPEAEIINLGLVEPYVDAEISCMVGSLVGCLANGNITNCYVEGGWVSGNKYIGGLIGDTQPLCLANPEDFVGEWLNDDPYTGGMTRLILGYQDSTMTVHGYGSCHPNDCDWGMIEAVYSGNPFVAVYEFGFVTTTLTIRLISPDSLHIHSSDMFHDETNRDMESDYFMHRSTESPVYPAREAVKKYGNSTISMCYSTASISGIDQVGGLIGNNYASVYDSHSSGKVLGYNDVGGLVGYNYGQIDRCSAGGSVRGDKYVGGLAGNNPSGNIYVSNAIGSVYGRDRVGGLIGATYSSTISNCYAAGGVSGYENVGGLLGHTWGASVSNCYSRGIIVGKKNIGGFLGWFSWGIITDCFWDLEASGQSMSEDGTGLSMAAMKTANTFINAGWDFIDEAENGKENIWWIDEGKDYPRLWFELSISSNHPDYDEWVEVGEPVCWCYKRQCHGDTDGKPQGKHQYWVSTDDLDVLIAAWNKPFAEIDGRAVNGAALICADFDHKAQGKENYRVSTDDLDILIANWSLANAPAADCP